MPFDAPIPFESAMQIIAKKKLMPTAWSTEELRSNLSREVRQMSLFSARTTCAAYLEPVQQILQDFAAGKINESTARQLCQEQLDAVGYTPEKGFGDDKSIPPAEEGSLRDLSSDKRVKLMVTTNVRLARNTAYMAAGQDADRLEDYPCWELVRVAYREVPRGYKRTKNGIEEVADDDWPSRWEKCGGTLYNGRMRARKDDEIWSELGDSSMFDDGMDTDAPPYAFGSGMGIREVPRQECVELGVIDADTAVEPDDVSLTDSLFESQPETATLADLKAARGELLAALEKYRNG